MFQSYAEFYHTFMHSNSFNGAVVGDFNKQIIETKLNKLTGGWETKVPYQRIQTRVANKETINKLIDTPDKAGAALELCILLPCEMIIQITQH